jgi:S-formylglutathione hydrolase FrmB
MGLQVPIGKMIVLQDIEIDSKKLGMRNRVKLFIPDTGKEVYPVIYMQHGLGDDEQTPWLQSRLASYAERYELMVVTSNAAASWFCNDERDGRLWEDYFVYELPSFIESRFPSASKAEARGQCGFSMGGYGAMLYTLLHPDRFGAVSTHSGSFIFGHEFRADRPEREELMKAVAPPGGRYDLFALDSNHPGLLSSAPAVRFDVGLQDRLLEQNRRFHGYLDDIGLVHEYVENTGSHEWTYVDAHLEESLKFLSKNLQVLGC